MVTLADVEFEIVAGLSLVAAQIASILPFLVKYPLVLPETVFLHFFATLVAFDHIFLMKSLNMFP